MYNGKGYLERINSESTSYLFAYDAFGNSDTVSIGNRTLIDNVYGSNNGLLERSVYGNNDVVEIIYDEYDRVIGKKYNGTEKYKYYYDSEGRLGKTEDLVNGSEDIYIYDLLGRVVERRITGGRKFTYSYNNIDKTVSFVYYPGTASSNSFKSEFTYGLDNRLEKFIVRGGTASTYVNLNYAYDDLGRLKSRGTLEIDYLDVDENYTTGLTESLIYKRYGSVYKTYTYTYDALGNIKTESENGVLKESYTYDSKNQLVRHDSARNNKTVVYEYDNAGNILSVKTYAYTLSSLEGISPIDTKVYLYEDSTWGDLLTSYNGSEIVYDSIGNPISYKGYTNDFEGRQLISMTNGSKSLTFKYDENGLRQQKTVNGVTTEYVYDDAGNLVHMKKGTTELFFYYDANGTRIAVRSSTGSMGYYMYNAKVAT